MPKLLPILNDPHYGTERSHNGLRLALSLAEAPDVAVRVQQSIAEAVGCAMVGQCCPDGYYTSSGYSEASSQKVPAAAPAALAWRRAGSPDADPIEGAHRSSIVELTEWTLWAYKVVGF